MTELAKKLRAFIWKLSVDTDDMLQRAERLQDLHTCYHCGHTGNDVNKYAHRHVGGIGEVSDSACDDPEACIRRVEHGSDLETQGVSAL